MNELKVLMLMLAIGNIVYAMMMMAGYLRAGVADASMRLWTWAKLVEGCAYIAFWLRPDLPAQLGMLLANGLLIAAAIGQTGAYCMFLGLRWRHRLLAAVLLGELLLVGVVMLATSPDQMTIQVTILMSLIIAAQAGVNAFILIGMGRNVALLRRVIAIPNLVLWAAFLVRAWVAAEGGTAFVFSPGPTQTMIYLGAYFLLIVNGLGFVMLCAQKDEGQLRALATTDTLTGLVNRHAFLDEAGRARDEAVRTQQPLTLMMIDIDHFKGLNDRHGQAAADHALRIYAEAAGRALRPQDLMGRLDGEEFAVLLPATAIVEAFDAAEKLRSAVAGTRFDLQGAPHSLTVSVGIARLFDDETVGEALVRADRALHRAKRNGRNRVEVHAAHLAPSTPGGMDAGPGTPCAA